MMSYRPSSAVRYLHQQRFLATELMDLLEYDLTREIKIGNNTTSYWKNAIAIRVPFWSQRMHLDLAYTGNHLTPARRVLSKCLSTRSYGRKSVISYRVESYRKARRWFSLDRRKRALSSLKIIRP